MINENIALLAYLKYSVSKKICDAVYQNSNEIFSEVKEDSEVFEIVFEKLGFDFRMEDLISVKIDFKKYTGLMDFVLANCIENNTFSDRLIKYHGKRAKSFYFFLLALFLIKGFSSACTQLEKIKTENLRQEKKVKKFLEGMYQFRRDLMELLAKTNIKEEYACTDLVNKKYKLFVSQFLNCSDSVSSWAKLNKSISDVLNNIYPDYPLIQEKLDSARAIISDLQKCPVGKSGWGTYEKTCINALTFLFVPPFKKIYIQKRTHDGYERRDAVLSNNHYSGFWKDIKEEFGSKNIICEFKNLKSLDSKESLNQLRIYLSKITIGKFGLLFTRGLPTKAVLKAQRDAYEQNGILILIISDAILKKMLLANAYLGTCIDILEDMKTSFEMEY